MSKKFNGLCLLRFKKSDIYPDGGQGKPKHYKALFKDAIIKTFYLDEENGYLYMQVQSDPFGRVPGIYRIALDRIENLETGEDVEGNENLTIADCELIDDSPIKVEGAQDSGEIANVAQINSDGEYIYWSYVAPATDADAIRNSVPLDVNNPLHHSGIKCIPAKPGEDGTMSTTVTFAVEGVEAYGVCGATYVEENPGPGPQPGIKGDVNGDGEVNIADINAVIDLILTGRVNPSGDVNGDGEVNIADINSIIDIILS